MKRFKRILAFSLLGISSAFSVLGVYRIGGWSSLGWMLSVMVGGGLFLLLIMWLLKD